MAGTLQGAVRGGTERGFVRAWRRLAWARGHVHAGAGQADAGVRLLGAPASGLCCIPGIYAACLGGA